MLSLKGDAKTYIAADNMGYQHPVRSINDIKLSGKPEIRKICFILLVCTSILLWWQPFVQVLTISLENNNHQHYSHILLIPFLSFYLLYVRRAVIFSEVEWSPWLGSTIMMAGNVLCLSASEPTVEKLDALPPVMLSIVTICWGAFLLCYGARSFRAASFGLGLLIFMVPLPSFLLDAIVGFLQRSSAEATNELFSLLGVPVFREGFVFSLSSFTIHVAEECSGIRSALSLLITSLVAGHLFLKSGWGKLALVAVIIPLTIVKNAVRIVGLALLANYVDPHFITDSALHQYGGIPVFVLALGVVFTCTWLIGNIERRFGYVVSSNAESNGMLQRQGRAFARSH